MTIYIPHKHLGKLAASVSPAAKKTHDKAKAKEAFQKLHARIQRNLIGLPAYKKEHIFHPKRLWRIDYAWIDLKIGLEVHGGHRSNGRHVRGTGFAEDRAKMNEAQLHGWIILEVTTDNIKDMRDWIERAINMRTEQNSETR